MKISERILEWLLVSAAAISQFIPRQLVAAEEFRFFAALGVLGAGIVFIVLTCAAGLLNYLF
jgi:hypothetical protein